MSATITKTKTRPRLKIKRDSPGNRNKLLVYGSKLTTARIDAGLSATEVARRIGCNKSSISLWEQEKLTPSEERLLKLVEMYGTAEFLDWNSVSLDRLAELGAKVKEITEGKNGRG